MKLEEMLDRLTPEKRELAMQLLASLLGDEAPTTALASPADGIPLWEANLRADGKSPRTIALYKETLRGYLREDPKPTRLSVAQNMAAKIDQVSAARVSTYQRALKSLFAFLYEQGLWHEDPCAKMKIIKSPAKERHCPSDEDFQAILSTDPFNEAWRNTQYIPRFRLMTILLADTGLRLGEAVTILRINLRLERNEIKVMGKGRKERIVPISDLTVALIHECLATAPASKYLFVGDSGGHWYAGAYRRTLARTCERAGVKVITPHQLRHYFATSSLKDGADLGVISRILGHASVAITMDVYRHIDEGEMHEEHKKHGPLTKLNGNGTEGK